MNNYTNVITENCTTMDIKEYTAYVNSIYQTKAYLNTIIYIEDLYDDESMEINLGCASDIQPKTLAMLLRYYKRGSFFVQLFPDEKFPEEKEEAIDLAKRSRFWRFHNLSFNWGGKDHERGRIIFYNEDGDEKKFFLDGEDIIDMMTLTEEDYTKYYC